MKKGEKKLRKIIVTLLVACMSITMMPVSLVKAADSGVIQETTVMELVRHYMTGRENAIINGETESLSDAAVKGIINDEIEHGRILHENNIARLAMSYQISEILFNDTMTFVTLNETIQYVLDGVVRTEDIIHNLVIMYDETGVGKIVSDSYIEVSSEFESCSYISCQEGTDSLVTANTDASSEIVSVAESQVGYLEKASNSDLDDFTANAGTANYTKYGEWYGVNPAVWCAMFVSWCANQAEVSTSVIPKYASCSTGMQNFKNLNCFHYSAAYNGNYTPKGGNIFFVGSSETSSSHTGIVAEVSNSAITVVDGNWNNQVSRHTYSLTNSSLIGFASPSY